MTDIETHAIEGLMRTDGEPNYTIVYYSPDEVVERAKSLTAIGRKSCEQRIRIMLYIDRVKEYNKY